MNQKKVFLNQKKYYDYDNTQYIGLLDIENLFNQSKDYYKPIKSTNGFDHKNNYIEYKSKGGKDKIYCLKNILI